MDAPAITVESVVPVLRMFDSAKAREFYVDWLGFNIDWEHRFSDNAPLYMQISLGDLRLHLSEHHGDGSPGAIVLVNVLGLEEWHRELLAKQYRYMRPGIEKQEWNAKTMTVIDPFVNRIRFNEETRD